MQCDGKFKHATERLALDELKRFRRDRHLGGHQVNDVNVYLCPRCGFWHLGHNTDGIKKRAIKFGSSEWKKLKYRVEDVGRRIAADELRIARGKLAELAAVVEADRQWLRLVTDQAESHAENLRAIEVLLAEHFARESGR